MKKKIIYTTASLEDGGASVYFINLLKCYDKSNYSVYVIVPSKGKYLKALKELTTDIFTLEFDENNLALFLNFRKIVELIQPDVIYSHLVKCSFVSVIASLGLNVRHISNLHSEYNLTIIPSFHKLILYRILIFLLQFKVKFIVVSKYMKQQFLRYGVSKSRIKIIYNGIAINRPEEDQKNSTVFTVIYIGRLVAEKGVLKILKIAQKLNDVHFDIVGDGNLKEELGIKIKNKKIKNVTLLGFQSNIEKLLRKSSILLLPSESESFGLVIAEAMACKLPVIASNVGGIPELIIDGEGGWLCNPDDIDCFAGKIKYLHDNPTLIEKFGIFNRQRYEALFTLEKMMSQLEEFYY